MRFEALLERLRLLRALLESERSRDAGGHELGVGNGGKGNEEYTIVELLQKIRRRLQREAGLASAPRAREREQAHLLAAKPLGDLGNLPLTAYQRGGLYGQVVGVAFERPKGRELGRQTGRHKLE